jgi:hypothetical protein
VAAGIEESPDLARSIARQQDRMTADMGGDEVVRVRDLRFQADEVPGSTTAS